MSTELDQYMNAREISDKALKVWEEDPTLKNDIAHRTAYNKTVELHEIYTKIQDVPKIPAIRTPQVGG